MASSSKRKKNLLPPCEYCGRRRYVKCHCVQSDNPVKFTDQKNKMANTILLEEVPARKG